MLFTSRKKKKKKKRASTVPKPLPRMRLKMLKDAHPGCTDSYRKKRYIMLWPFIYASDDGIRAILVKYAQQKLCQIRAQKHKTHAGGRPNCTAPWQASTRTHCRVQTGFGSSSTPRQRRLRQRIRAMAAVLPNSASLRYTQLIIIRFSKKEAKKKWHTNTTKYEM